MALWMPGYVEVLPGFDGAFCPDPVPAGFKWCMVYAGGTSAERKTGWDPAELARVAHLPRLVVWVPTPGSDDPVQVVANLVHWLDEQKVPKVNVHGFPFHVMWDMETGKEPDPEWLDVAANHFHAQGGRSVVYGSISTLFGQPPRDGYVVANPTNTSHMYSAVNVKATQYQFNVSVPGGKIDKSNMAVELYRQLWLPETA